jgi:uncharacterized coiled-coil DUF342 family protein
MKRQGIRAKIDSLEGELIRLRLMIDTSIERRDKLQTQIEHMNEQRDAVRRKQLALWQEIVAK